MHIDANRQCRAWIHIHPCFNESGIYALNIAIDRPSRQLRPVLWILLVFSGLGEVSTWGFSPQMDSGVEFFFDHQLLS